MITAHLNLLRSVSPCAGAPTLSFTSVTTTGDTCAGGTGIFHQGNISLSGTLPVGLKIEWQVQRDGDGASWVTPTGGQYTTPGGTTGSNDDEDPAYDTAGSDGAIEIGAASARFRVRVVGADGTPCGDGSWVTSSRSTPVTMYECT